MINSLLSRKETFPSCPCSGELRNKRSSSCLNISQILSGIFILPPQMCGSCMWFRYTRECVHYQSRRLKFKIKAWCSGHWMTYNLRLDFMVTSINRVTIINLCSWWTSCVPLRTMVLCWKCAKTWMICGNFEWRLNEKLQLDVHALT